MHYLLVTRCGDIASSIPH